MKNMNTFLKKWYVIVIFAVLVIAAVMILILMTMNKVPEKTAQPSVMTDISKSVVNTQTTSAEILQTAPTNADTIKPTDDPVTLISVDTTTQTDVQSGTQTTVDPTKSPDDAITPSNPVLPSDTSESTADTTASTDEPTPPTPTAPPAQPIAYRNISSMISGIKGFDYEVYDDPERSAYERMIETLILGDGILSVKTDDKIQLYENASVWLQPYAHLEDIGIIEWVTYKDIKYQVCIYNFDADVDAKSMEDYLVARFKENVNDSVIVNKKAVCLTTFGNTDETRKICGSAEIDDTHYYTVRVQGTEEQLIEFLSILTFEKNEIQN